MKNKIKAIIQFEEYVIPDKEIMMPCVPAVGSWITFPYEHLKYPENGVPIDCNEFRVTFIDYNIAGGEVSKIYVSVCKNTMIGKNETE